jgi:hypothetical protein
MKCLYLSDIFQRYPLIIPKLKMEYETKGTPGRRKIQKHEGSVKKRKLNDSNDQFE